MEEDDDESSGGGGKWIVSYADLMTLLFATFVVLYGLKTEGETIEERGIVSSIRESFIEIPDDITDPDIGPTNKGKTVLRNWNLEKRYERFIKKHNKNNNNVNVIEEDMKKIRKLIEPETKKKVKKFVKKDKKYFSLMQEGNKIVVSLASSLIYEKDSFRLSRQQLINIKPLAKFLATLDRDLIIEAYAQNTDKYRGLELASLRATFLLKNLNRDFNVPLRRIYPFGYELSNEDSKKSQKLGQRVDIKIIYE